jgi:pyridoxal 5'-phosphate synthase pdxS subunit
MIQAGTFRPRINQSATTNNPRALSGGGTCTFFTYITSVEKQKQTAKYTMAGTNGNGSNGGENNGANGAARIGTTKVKQGLAQMLKGGVIMDVMNVEQAKIAEAAGAVAVMALERIPADIRRDGGVARMSDPAMILEIKNAVTIPVMAKARIGHFIEARILEACEVDYIDESEVLTMADDVHHIDKVPFNVPFVCGCRDLGEALRRIAEGAAMLRTKGEAGTGNIVEAVRHARTVQGQIKRLSALSKDELYVAAKEMRAPYELVRQVASEGRLPVVNFAAGGVATPADAALMMHLGMDGVFVGSGIFKSSDPEARARAIVRATTHYMDYKVLMEASTGLGPAMVGICDIKGDPVNFRDREGGEYVYEGKVPPKRELHGHTETQVYGSSWAN